MAADALLQYFHFLWLILAQCFILWPGRKHSFTHLTAHTSFLLLLHTFLLCAWKYKWNGRGVLLCDFFSLIRFLSGLLFPAITLLSTNLYSLTRSFYRKVVVKWRRWSLIMLNSLTRPHMLMEWTVSMLPLSRRWYVVWLPVNNNWYYYHCHQGKSHSVSSRTIPCVNCYW